MNKEQAYDEKLNPLMAQIIAICQEHGIAMVASFAIPTEEDNDLRCTSCIPDESDEHSPGHMDVMRILGAIRQPAMHLRTDHGDGSVTMTAIVG